MRLLLCATALALTVTSCGDTGRVAPLAERGAELAGDPAVTRSRYNHFACTTCHAVRASDAGDRILPGAPLQGAARRPSYWGGEVTHLREAVERCWTGFMRGVASDLDGPDGQALDAWLLSISPEGSTEGTAAVPRVWTRTVRDPGEGGDRTRALALWARGCQRCHGAYGTGAGRLGSSSVVPRDTLTEHCDDDLMVAGFTDRQAYIRGVLAEKVRHGSFLGYAGVMPPFTTEVLSDDDVRQLAALFTCP